MKGINMFEIIFYETDKQSPIDDFLNELKKSEKAKVQFAIERLEEEGEKARRPLSAYVRNKIYELRTKNESNEFRILYFFFIDKKIILLHGFKKKTQKLKEKDIKLAESRMADWIRRFGH